MWRIKAARKNGCNVTYEGAGKIIQLQNKRERKKRSGRLNKVNVDSLSAR